MHGPEVIRIFDMFVIGHIPYPKKYGQMPAANPRPRIDQAVGSLADRIFQVKVLAPQISGWRATGN